MADPYERSRGATRTVSFDTSDSVAPFACYTCRRRKLKCDRALPGCSPCQKAGASVTCEYPTHAEKPGPKTGSSQRKKRKRLDQQPPGHEADDLRGSISAAPTSPVQFRVVCQDESARSPGHEPEASPSGRRNSHHSDRLFSRIMYPSHDLQTRPASPSTPNASPGHAGTTHGVTVESVCESLRISRVTYNKLLEQYFSNMTAFSLFRADSIETKLSQMCHQSEADALIAAMFSFSARHASDVSVGEPTEYPEPSYFAQLATSQLHQSLDRYGDLSPPFWLLQASVLITHYHLTRSVRSRSWRTLGDCIRLAYDLNLHIVDANYNPDKKDNRGTGDKEDILRWSLLEERRRAWWAIWEMDVFASTIRQLPTAIDGSLNLTLLPVPDDCWVGDTFQESCFLVEDCSLRWKCLSRSGNKSAKAWFIVMNSIMRNTQRIVYPSGSAMKAVSGKPFETNQDELDIMANSLYCTVTSVPTELLYKGETLDFRLDPSGAHRSRQEDADKYSLHLMTQLCRFMIYHHKICAHAPWLSKGASTDSTAQVNSEWSNYMNASDEIVTVVRNSSRDHYKYVNPFLANTLWFAAAAQCACRVFGPPTYNKRLTGSRLDLLKLTIDQFISFWDGMDNLKNKLARIEARLKNLMDTPANGTEGGQEPGAGLGPDTPRAGLNTASGSRRPADALYPTAGGQTPIASHTPLPSGMAASGLLDPNSSFVPDMYDFTQPLHVPMPDHDLFMTDPMNLSPFGLEELLMASMAHHF